MSETPAEIIASQLEADDDKCLRSYDIGAHHIIAALHDLGYKILPREPTEAMADRAIMASPYGSPREWRDAIFRAMWDAAP